MRRSSLSPRDRREVFAAIRKGRAVSDPRLAEVTRDEARRLKRLYPRFQWLWVGMVAFGGYHVVATATNPHLTGGITGPLDVVAGSLLFVMSRRSWKRAQQAEQANAALSDRS